MKRFLKTFVCMVLPLTLSACSFGENNNNSQQSSQYEVVSKAEAASFAGKINQGREVTFGHVQARYKSKVQQSSDDSGKTSDACSYEVDYTHGAWQERYNASNVDRYCTYSYNFFLSYWSLKDTISSIGYLNSDEVSTRYSIDRANEKVKVEMVFKNEEPQQKIRIEYDNTLYLRSGLYSLAYNSGKVESVSSQFAYDSEIDPNQDVFNHDYTFVANNNGPLYQDQWNSVNFSYYRDGIYCGYVNFYEMTGTSVITGFDCSNCQFNVADNFIDIYPYGGANYAEIYIYLFDGSVQPFSFDVTPNIWSADWMSVTDAVNLGYAGNSRLFRTNVYVSGFYDGLNQPTEFGAFYVTDWTGNQYILNYSTLRPAEEWIHYSDGYYYYDAYSDFYYFAPIGTQYGIEFYPSSLMYGDNLEILYAVDGGAISFAYIMGVGMNDRLSERHAWTGNLQSAFEHASAYGEGRYIYTSIPMRITGFYGSYTNPTNYGSFHVSDMDGTGDYTIYYSAVYRDQFEMYTFNGDTFTFNCPRDFLSNDMWLGEVNGNPIYPRDLMPGDVLSMNFIIVNGRIQGIIEGFDFSARYAALQPEVLSLSLSEIFQRNDGNLTRMYSHRL